MQGGVLGGTFQSLSNNIALIGTYTVAPAAVDSVVLDSVFLGWNGDGAAVLSGLGTLASSGIVTVQDYFSQARVVLSDGIVWDNAGTIALPARSSSAPVRRTVRRW